MEEVERVLPIHFKNKVDEIVCESFDRKMLNKNKILQASLVRKLTEIDEKIDQKLRGTFTNLLNQSIEKSFDSLHTQVSTMVETRMMEFGNELNSKMNQKIQDSIQVGLFEHLVAKIFEI